MDSIIFILDNYNFLFKMSLPIACLLQQQNNFYFIKAQEAPHKELEQIIAVTYYFLYDNFINKFDDYDYYYCLFNLIFYYLSQTR